VVGIIPTFSLKARISSTLLLEAPSISIMQEELPAVISRQTEQTLHGVGIGPFSQFNALANIRAVEVFPTPRGPENKNEWASRELFNAFTKTRVICSCPNTDSKVWGRHLRASTK
jgi:hypothetical protein